MKLRWIIVITVVILGLSWFATVVVVRQVNLRALKHDQEVLAAAGLAVSWDAVDLPPPLDPEVSAAVLALSTSGLSIAEPPALAGWVPLRRDPVPPSVQAVVDTANPTLIQFLTLLDRPDFRIGLAAHLNQFLKDQTPHKMWFSGLGDYFLLRSVAVYLRCVACVSKNPSQALQRSDHLVMAMARRGLVRTATRLCRLKSAVRRAASPLDYVVGDG